MSKPYHFFEAENKRSFTVTFTPPPRFNLSQVPEVILKSLDYSGFCDMSGNPEFDNLSYQRAKREAENLVKYANRNH